MPRSTRNIQFGNKWTTTVAEQLEEDEALRQIAIEAAQDGPEELAYKIEDELDAEGLAAELIAVAMERVIWQEIIDYLEEWSA